MSAESREESDDGQVFNYQEGEPRLNLKYQACVSEGKGLSLCLQEAQLAFNQHCHSIEEKESILVEFGGNDILQAAFGIQHFP